jgi:hypothetical protein
MIAAMDEWMMFTEDYLFRSYWTHYMITTVAQVCQKRTQLSLLEPLRHACQVKHTLVIIMTRSNGHSADVSKMVNDDL